MSVLHRVAIKSLLKNKTRTVVTVIGIILSASMICAVTTFASSIYNYALENSVYKYGDWHGSASGADQITLEGIISSGKVKNTVYATEIGYAMAESQNIYKPYLYILGATEGVEATLPIHITSGRYPTSDKEILLPLHLAENGGVVHKIGDTLTLDIGKRVSGGYELWQENPFEITEIGEEGETEELVIIETRNYTVVGFYERPAFERVISPGYTAITLAGERDGDKELSVWFKMKKPRDAYDFIWNTVGSFSKNETQSLGENNAVLNYSGATGYGGIDSTITLIAVIIIGLIMFGSISLIYNAFSISVSERTKQFGLLSSVGATKKQLRTIVFLEALYVGAVGIPLGVLSGIGGIGITLIFVGDKFEHLFGYDMPMHLSVSPAAVITAIVVSAATLLLSAWLPSKRATKVSAVEAIRQSRDVSVEAKKVRTSKLSHKLFGISGVLAIKYYKRSKKKYRATVLSLFMSVVLFVSAASFTSYLLEVQNNFSPQNFDIVYHHDSGSNKVSAESLLERFWEDEAVTDVALTWDNYEYVELPKNAVNSEAFDDKYSLVLQETDKTVELYSHIKFLDKENYEKLIKENRLDKAEYLSVNVPKAIAIDTFNLLDRESGKYNTLDILKKENITASVNGFKTIEGFRQNGFSEVDGEIDKVYYLNENTEEEFELSAEEAHARIKIQIGDTVNYHPFYSMGGGEGLILVYPLSAKDSIFKIDESTPAGGGFGYNYFFLSSDHDKSFKAIKNTVSEHGMPSDRVSDYAEGEEEVKNTVVLIQVFAYGFIVLISLIAVANVFNTVSTNVALRRREFAMLKSMGMTAGGFNRMMCFECILYGTRALFYGLPVSAVVTGLIYLAMNEGFDLSYRLPLGAVGIAALSVFAVVFITMMYSMRKIKKDNPIDALRNENL